MKVKRVSPAAQVPARTKTWPELVVVFAVGLAAFGLVSAQVARMSGPPDRQSLATLDQRVGALRKAKDSIQRDSMCIPLSAYGRALDRAIAKDARIFFSGLVGKTNGGKLGYYYFLQNYLFPRHVELSFGTNADFHCEYFGGVDCESPDVLRTNGYDLMLKYSGEGIQLVPLTEKGVPRE